MQAELVTIQPQVIQFNRQNTQTIKITNNTTASLNNFFFCLYNVQKFSFKPQTFSLAPKEHKLIQITLKIKSTKSIAKQFAYLKSTDINKRLTLLINNFHSPESRTKQTQEGYSDMNTLSSRDYHQLHNRALNKIIAQQSKYIVDETHHVRQFNKTQNFSIGSSSKKDFYGQQIIKQLEGRNILLEREIEDLNELVIKKDFEIEKIENENKFLSDQGGKLMKKISEKQTRIKQLQNLYQKIVNQNQQYSVQMNELRNKIQQIQKSKEQSSKQKKQRQSEISKLYKNYESRIKQLQNIVQSSQRQSIIKFNRQFKIKIQEKEEEINKLRKYVQEQEDMIKEYQKNQLKIQNENKHLQQSKKTLEQNKKKLQIQNKQIMSINNNLKQQIFVYKSRIQDQSSNKIQQYLEIALQSYKNQNQSLKKSKFQLQRSLQSIVNTNRQNLTEKQFLQTRIQTLTKQLNKTQQNLIKQMELNQLIKQQNHHKIKQITQKNILLLQKIAQENNTKRQLQTSRLLQQIDSKNLQINNLNHKINLINSQFNEKIKSMQKQLQKVTQLQNENKKLEQKVRKYKKQTKRQLKSINENAFDELKRIHDEKKQLQKKVHKLQKTISKLQSNNNSQINYNNSQLNQNQYQARTTQINSKSQINAKSQINGQQEVSEESYDKQNQFNLRSKSQYETGQRKIGIFNQRPQLYETRSNSTKNVNLSNQPVNTTHNYELYELRQFCAFVNNQERRFQYIFNLQAELADPVDHNDRPLTNIKPLYKAIKFFKVIENKIKGLQQKADQSIILTRQNNFIRQKMTQLQKSNQNKDQNKKDLSAITVNNPLRVQEQSGSKNQAQQEQGSSFLVNRTNLTNMNVFEMIQFLKGEMKKQYNKQVENIKFLQDKTQIFKKKVYREYRSRIIELINENTKKQNKSNLVGKIQNLIERFIEGLSNMSHKEAVLNKQIKIKNNYKQENNKLKNKINQLEHILSQKHNSYCNRDPVKVFNCTSFINNPNFKQQEWMQSIKLSAQLLTQKAQNQRLKQEIIIIRQDLNQLREEYNDLLNKNQLKDGQIIKMKKNQLQLEKQYQKQLSKQYQLIQQTKSKLNNGNNKNKNKSKLEQKFKQKERQIQSLKIEIQKKNMILKNYKEKQKKWQEYINQTNRTQQKQTKLLSSYKRIQENNTMIKQNNRELREQNNLLKQTVQKLQKQLQKKKLYIKNLKGQDQENRITKPLRIQESVQKIKELEDELKSARQQVNKLKKNKDKDILRLQSQLSSAKNQALIHIRSLQSVVRATIQTIRKIFTSFKILIKKKGQSSRLKKGDLVVPQNLIQINAAQIYQQFQQILQALDS